MAKKFGQGSSPPFRAMPERKTKFREVFPEPLLLVFISLKLEDVFRLMTDRPDAGDLLLPKTEIWNKFLVFSLWIELINLINHLRKSLSSADFHSFKTKIGHR